LADAATVVSATFGSVVKAGTATASDSVAAGVAAAFLDPPQQLLAATGATVLALAASLGSGAAGVEQQEVDMAAVAAADD
jgi:hypothetical protein